MGGDDTGAGAPADGGSVAAPLAPADGGGGGGDKPPDAVEPPPSPMEKEVMGLRAKAKSVEHLRTHFPKNPWCPICQRANARRKQRRDEDGQKLFGA
eukprot:1892788-Alexandrium_andersonii.AAC.1